MASHGPTMAASAIPTAPPALDGHGPSSGHGTRSSAASVSSSAGSACSCGSGAAHGHGGHGHGQKVLFRWTHDADSVSVVGSWNGWGKPLPLEGTTDAFGRGHLFSRIVELPPGRHHVRICSGTLWL